MAYIICWYNKNGSNWELVGGRDAMEQRIDELLSEGKEVPYVFDDDDEIDKKERSVASNDFPQNEISDSILEKKYIEQGAKQCPFCDSSDLSCNGYNFKDYVTVTATIACEDCEQSWVETYTLSTVKFYEL